MCFPLKRRVPIQSINISLTPNIVSTRRLMQRLTGQPIKRPVQRRRISIQCIAIATQLSAITVQVPNLNVPCSVHMFSFLITMRRNINNINSTRALETVNVGGLPFLPSATALVAKMLDKLIGDSPDSALERATLPTGIAEKLAQIDLDNRDVMVGIVLTRPINY